MTFSTLLEWFQPTRPLLTLFLLWIILGTKVEDLNKQQKVCHWPNGFSFQTEPSSMYIPNSSHLILNYNPPPKLSSIWLKNLPDTRHLKACNFPTWCGFWCNQCHGAERYECRSPARSHTHTWRPPSSLKCIIFWLWEVAQLSSKRPKENIQIPHGTVEPRRLRSKRG